MSHETYASRKSRLLKGFDKSVSRVKQVLVARYGEEEANTLSQERKYAGGYVLAYVEGDGQDFDYGIDYIECASCKFLNDQGATELGPYVCAVDRVASEMLGWGLRRTMTLAEGGERCDFRFKKGGKTCVTIPQSLLQKENGLDGKE